MTYLSCNYIEMHEEGKIKAMFRAQGEAGYLEERMITISSERLSRTNMKEGFIELFQVFPRPPLKKGLANIMILNYENKPKRYIVALDDLQKKVFAENS